MTGTDDCALNATTDATPTEEGSVPDESPPLDLVVAWCVHDPSRVGETVVAGPAPRVMVGRGRAGEHPRARIVRRRPWGDARQPPFADPRLSREQLGLWRIEGVDGLRVERWGRRSMYVNGVAVDRATEVHHGDLVRLGDRMVFLVWRREALPPEPHERVRFGERDRHEIIGESAAIWRLRRAIERYRREQGHVLVLGESGVGKELVANAIAGSRGPLVTASGAQLEQGVIDAELFGNIRNYPNPGMPEREGLFGKAENGTLFIDEFGELSPENQARFLRPLNEHGMYKRLGEDGDRPHNVRVVAATNRGLEELRTDIPPRFGVIEVPPLRQRRTDIPLLVRALLKKGARETPSWRHILDDDGEPRVACTLVEELLVDELRLNVRGLEGRLRQAVEATREGEIVRCVPERPVPAEPVRKRPKEVTADEVRAAVEAAGGNQSEAARALGISRDRVGRVWRKIRNDRAGILGPR